MKNEKKELPYYMYRGVKRVICNNVLTWKGAYKMSCCICDMETISVIVKGFIQYGYTGGYAKYCDDDYTEPVQNINELRQTIGQSLLNQNYRAFNSRYYDTDYQPPEFIYTDVEINEGLVYGCISCYEYQACEIENYYKSNIHYSLINLEHIIIKRLIAKVGQTAPYGYDGYNMLDKGN